MADWVGGWLGRWLGGWLGDTDGGGEPEPPPVSGDESAEEVGVTIVAPFSVTFAVDAARETDSGPVGIDGETRASFGIDGQMVPSVGVKAWPSE